MELIRLVSAATDRSGPLDNVRISRPTADKIITALNTIETQEKAIQSLRDQYNEHYTRNLEGSCICSVGDRKADHFPGCPMATKSKIEALTQENKELVEAFEDVVVRLERCSGFYEGSQSNKCDRELLSKHSPEEA